MVTSYYTELLLFIPVTCLSLPQLGLCYSTEIPIFLFSTSRKVSPPFSPRSRTAFPGILGLVSPTFPVEFSCCLLYYCSITPALFWVASMCCLSSPSKLLPCGDFVLLVFVSCTGPALIPLLPYCSVKCWVNTCDVMENAERFEIHFGKESVDTDATCKGALPCLPLSVLWSVGSRRPETQHWFCHHLATTFRHFKMVLVKRRLILPLFKIR